MLAASGRLKPPDPIWQPGRRPAGCVAYYALTERTGRTARECSMNAGDGAFVGSPIWQPGPMGSQLGGFTNAAYLSINGAAPLIGTAPPWWVAVLFANTQTANASALGFGSSLANPIFDLRLNQSFVNNLHYAFRDDAGVSAAVSVNSPACTDGRPHVLMGITRAWNRHEIWLDGLLGGTTGTTIGPITFTLADLGARPIAGVHANSFGGTLSAAAIGAGAIPDPWDFAQDWLTGRFAAVRAARRPAIQPAGLRAFIIPSAITSAESFGAVNLAASTTVTTTAIPSAEAFGTITTATSTTVTATAIPSAEAFGAVNVGSGVTLAVATIPSAESFGAMSLATAATVAIDAIPSAEAFGDASAEATATIAAAAIPSEEAFGSVLVFGAVPSSLYPVARRLSGQPDPKRTKIKYL